MARPWTPEEDATLREHYPAHGADWNGWAKLLPGRTAGAMHTRAYVLGLRYEGPPRGGYRIDLDKASERAATAVAALGEWQATRLALLVAVAGKEVEW